MYSRRRPRVLHQPLEQADLLVLLLHQRLTETVGQRQRAQRSDRVDEQRVRAVERVDEAAGRQPRPAPRLDGAADFQRELVEAPLPVARLDAPLARQPPEIAVGADVVEAVVVDADVGEVRRHALDRPRRPSSRNAASPVASNCSSAEPNWNPCVHSVQPRA